MNATLRFLVQRPPRTGWLLFGLATAAVLMPASLVLNGAKQIAAGPLMLAALAGLVLGLGGSRWRRVLLLLVALLVPLLLLDLAPPPGVLVDDLRALLTVRGRRPPLLLPSTLEDSAARVLATFNAAWQGDMYALNWAVAKLAAVFSYIAALLLGIGLRSGTRLMMYVLPLLAAIATIGITVQSSSFAVLLAVFPPLLLCVVGDFARRERAWERAGIDFSGLLRSDVTAIGGGLVAASIVLGLLTPSAARNGLTRWIWTDLPLPAGLQRLEERSETSGDGGALYPGGFRPGQALDLGRSLEEGNGDAVALLIRSPGLDSSSRPYWRGRILDEYSGRSWTTGPIRNVVAPPVALPSEQSDWIVQQVSDQRTGRQLRYGVADIVALDTGGWYEQDTLGTTAGWIGIEQQYTVYSSLPVPLDVAGPEAEESQRMLNSHLEVPDGLPQRVRDLVRQLTVNRQSQTARAEAIESYLRALPYSYEVVPLLANGDAVDQFLFEMRSGYCTYYASAMAIMARIAGIPSRVALGYSTGEYDAANQQFVVREANAHAWPELYIDGQGWTRWEPTAVLPVPARSTPSEQARPSLAAQQPAPQPAAGVSGWWAMIGLVVALTLLAAALNLRRLVVPLTPAGVHADLYRWGRRAGVAPRVADSIEEYATRLARSVPDIRQPVEHVARLLTARVYRARPLDADEERSLVSAWSRARSILRRRRG